MKIRRTIENFLNLYFAGIITIATICGPLTVFFPDKIKWWQSIYISLNLVWTGYCVFALVRHKILKLWRFLVPLPFIFLSIYLINIHGLPWISCKFLDPKTDMTANVREAYQPVVNLPWINYGTDFGKVTAWSDSGISTRQNLDNLFSKLKANGIESIVWHLFADGRASPEFDSLGNPTGFDDTFWKDYDDALKLAEENDLGIFWVLLDFKWFDPPIINDGATLGGHAEAVIDTAKQRLFFERMLTPLITRHPHNPNINGWILVNEPENAIKEDTSNQRS